MSQQSLTPAEKKEERDQAVQNRRQASIIVEQYRGRSSASPRRDANRGTPRSPFHTTNEVMQEVEAAANSFDPAARPQHAPAAELPTSIAPSTNSQEDEKEAVEVRGPTPPRAQQDIPGFTRLTETQEVAGDVLQGALTGERFSGEATPPVDDDNDQLLDATEGDDASPEAAAGPELSVQLDDGATEPRKEESGATTAVAAAEVESEAGSDTASTGVSQAQQTDAFLTAVEEAPSESPCSSENHGNGDAGPPTAAEEPTARTDASAPSPSEQAVVAGPLAAEGTAKGPKIKEENDRNAPRPQKYNYFRDFTPDRTGIILEDGEVLRLNSTPPPDRPDEDDIWEKPDNTGRTLREIYGEIFNGGQHPQQNLFDDANRFLAEEIIVIQYPTPDTVEIERGGVRIIVAVVTYHRLRAAVEAARRESANTRRAMQGPPPPTALGVSRRMMETYLGGTGDDPKEDLNDDDYQSLEDQDTDDEDVQVKSEAKQEENGRSAEDAGDSASDGDQVEVKDEGKAAAAEGQSATAPEEHAAVATEGNVVEIKREEKQRFPDSLV